MTDENEYWMESLRTLAKPRGVFEKLSSAIQDIKERLSNDGTKYGRIVQSLKWPLDQTYVQQTLGRIEGLKSSIIIAMNQANIALSQEMRSDISSVKRATDASEFHRIMEWLSPCIFEEHQESLEVTPGTGGWFFKSDPYNRWKSGQDRWLWCHGVPGAGKTFLAAQTVNELRHTHGESIDAQILVAFCTFTSLESQSVENILGALVKQAAQKHNVVPAALRSEYHKKFVQKKKLRLEELVDVLEQALAQYSPSFIVIDALDELYDDTKRHALLRALDSLRCQPKVMVTSRRVENIEQTMRKLSQNQLEIATKPEDVDTYVQRRIDSSGLHRIVDGRPDVISQIRDAVVASSKDM